MNEVKLWLWKNFVDGKPEYWAFDNAFPTHLDCGDPQTLGEPCGYALFKPSRAGRTDLSDDEVLRRVQASYKSQREWFGLTDEEIWSAGSVMTLSELGIRKFARAIEAKLKEKNT